MRNVLARDAEELMLTVVNLPSFQKTFFLAAFFTKKLHRIGITFIFIKGWR